MSPLSGSALHPLANDLYTNSTIQAFLKYMKENSCRGTTFGADSSLQPRRFYPDRVLKWYFDCSRQDDARRVKELVAVATARSYNRPDYRAVASDCPKVFTILAFIGQSHHINHFVQQARLQDNNLPFRPEDEVLFPVINDNTTFFKSFCERQWEFCVIPLRKRLGDVTFENDRILPILPLERVDKSRGSSASVHKIQVDEDYDLLGGHRGPQSEPHVYAIKSYYPSAADPNDPVDKRRSHGLPRPKNYYDAEVDAFRRLNESGEPIPNLVGFYGAITQSQSHHIILQYANIGTLEDYWDKVDPPRRGADILTLWSKVFEINRALVQIHENESDGDTGGPQIFQGWHEDIKPSNILVSGDIKAAPYEVHFMLADLGLSHFSAIVEGENNATREGRGGSQAYSAPERNHATNPASHFKPKIKQNIDTWSLACVYSEFNAWVVDGVRSGVLRYRQARMNHKDVDESLGACFHDKKGEVLSVVEEWHTNSLGLCARHDHVTPIIWKELLRHMLSPPKSRLHSQQVDTFCQDVLKTAQDRLERPTTREEPVLEVSQHSASPPHTPPQLPLEYYQHRRTQDGLNSYPLTPPDEKYEGKDFDHIGRSTRSPDRLSPARSPPDSRESAVSFPDYHQRSYPSGRTRVVSIGTDETTQTTFMNIPQRTSMQEPPFSKSENVAIRRKPPEMIQSEPSRRSTMPAELTPVSTRFLGPTEQVQSFDTVESYDWPDSTTVKGKERVVDDRQPREPPNSQPERFLSVEDLKHWEHQTRKASKSRYFLSREQEIPLPFQDELLVELRKRDHVFLIDDGRSMYPHWDELLSLYSPMIYMVKKKRLDPNGSELRFIMSDQRKEAEDTSPLIKMVKERKERLSGQSNLAHRLEDIFVEYCKKLQRNPTTASPISLYIFTDGKWQPGEPQLAEVGSIIKRLVEFLEKRGFPQKMAGVQFIQFGNDPDGTKRLQWLDEDLPEKYRLARDICDTTPANDNVWKMLLGSINSYWDNDKRQSFLSTKPDSP